jgi:hypothetical protein
MQSSGTLCCVAPVSADVSEESLNIVVNNHTPQSDLSKLMTMEVAKQHNAQ